MGLNKFDHGQIHSMRSSKSYHHELPSWNNNDPATCAISKKVPVTFNHAILSCRAKRPPKDPSLHAISSLAPNAHISSSSCLLSALSSYQVQHHPLLTWNVLLSYIDHIVDYFSFIHFGFLWVLFVILEGLSLLG